MSASLSIVDAIGDGSLFAPHFRDLATWQSWIVLAKALFGLQLNNVERAILTACACREAPADGVRESWMIVGRRGGKSRFLAVVAAFLSALCDWRTFLAPGERGYV